MKRKLIVTLVASALELYAAAATAQVTAGSCVLPNGANAANFATEVTTGPLNPTNGFPEYLTDSTGLSVQRCLDPDRCFFDPIVPSDPFSLQIGSGGEAFYWDGSARVANAAGDRILTLVYAAETAFLEAGPNDEPIDGSQFPFLRMRFVMGVPVDGTYTVKHPYGINIFRVTGATGARDVAETIDHGFAPNSSVTGPVGPFLVPTGSSANGVPAGFVADGGAGGAGGYAVTGSPCGFNRVEVSGVDTAGNPVDFGNNEFVVSTDTFSLQGMIYDGKVQTPLSPTRTTYSRSLAGAGQIDTFATSTAAATVTVQDGPTIPVDTSRIPDALTMGRVALDDSSINSLSVPVTDAAALPPVLVLTATAAATDVTTLNVHVVDFVDITQADYDPSTKILSVSAISGDQRQAPKLTLRDFGEFTAGDPVMRVMLNAPPAVVHVDSAAGGSATAQVRVAGSKAPAAPSQLGQSLATAATIMLSWQDNASNESGFKVYAVAPTGARTLVSTTPGNIGPNATSVVVNGLTPSTTYTFQIEAFNGAGANSSPTLSASTLALPAAPAEARFDLSTSAQRRIDVSWDASADATGYQVYRKLGAAAYTLLGTVSGTSYADLNGMAGTTHTYQVVALRTINGITDASTATTSAAQTTPTVPSSPNQVAFGAITGSSIVVNWNDRSTNEAGFQVFRRTGTTGGFAAVSAVLPTVSSTGQGTAGRTTTDTSVVAGTQYTYRVDVSNWAGVSQSAVSAAVVAQDALVLNAVTDLAVTAITANPPALSWGDATAGETGYRVQRRTVTLANNGTRTNGNYVTARTTAANVTSYTDSARPANRIVEYSVTAMNGTTPGPVTTVLAVPGGIPGVAAAPTFTVLGGNNVRLNWAQAGTTAANRGGIGGYIVQRCEATPADACAAASTGWAQVAAVTGRTTLRTTMAIPASNPAKTYRFRVISTTGTNAVTSVTGTPSPASNTLVR
ncbi:MAG: fibronectin type III domain-containing protein [Burkholderiales bacterium]|nr:fibronectin type III domain-containing protein [Burkholderiales bacterium]